MWDYQVAWPTLKPRRCHSHCRPLWPQLLHCSQIPGWFWYSFPYLVHWYLLTNPLKGPRSNHSLCLLNAGGLTWFVWAANSVSKTFPPLPMTRDDSSTSSPCSHSSFSLALVSTAPNPHHDFSLSQDRLSLLSFEAWPCVYLHNCLESVPIALLGPVYYSSPIGFKTELLAPSSFHHDATLFLKVLVTQTHDYPNSWLFYDPFCRKFLCWVFLTTFNNKVHWYSPLHVSLPLFLTHNFAYLLSFDPCFFYQSSTMLSSLASSPPVFAPWLVPSSCYPNLFGMLMVWHPAILITPRSATRTLTICPLKLLAYEPKLPKWWMVPLPTSSRKGCRPFVLHMHRDRVNHTPVKWNEPCYHDPWH